MVGMTAAAAPALADSELPAAFRAVDASSDGYQTRAIAATRNNLILLIIAAISGAVDVKADVGDTTLNLGGVGSVLAFGCALLVTLATAARRPYENWYKARAGAESVKTLAWRYAVGGDPFPKGMDDVDVTFTDRVGGVIHGLKDLEWPPPATPDQITTKMRRLRHAPRAQRMQAYLADRIDDQYRWYTKKAAVSRQRANQWERAAAAASTAGIIAGVLRALTVLDLDLIGVLAAVGAAASAWTQMRQHRTLASSYGLAAQELALVKARSANVEDEAEWSQFVSDAEEAISREHTMWLARHGQAGSGA
jgi:SMODS and SLOG-associating 2TM effector domain 1/SMODS and SLOG-associating 2TM effector domain 3